MNVQHLTARDFLRQPWKNGGGSTLELASLMHEGRLLWRLSIADVERSGPFSDFSGYERTIMLLEGDGMALTIDDAPPVRIAQPFAPLVFDGGSKTDCALLGGPIKDFNLMVDRERACGALLPRQLGKGELPIACRRWSLIYCASGQLVVSTADATQRLAAGELLRIDADSQTTAVLSGLTSDCTVATALIEPR